MPVAAGSRVCIVGPGNVGATLAFHLVKEPTIRQIDLVSRRPESAVAAILDIASADPVNASKLSANTPGAIEAADIIAITSAEAIRKGEAFADHYRRNLEINLNVLQGVKLKSDAVLIIVSAPIDDLVVALQRHTQLPPAQVLGFGGDLDLNRLIYALRRRKIESQGAMIIGEHGANAIPVGRNIVSDSQYFELADEVRTFVAKIASAGRLRNLAAAAALARLVRSISADADAEHVVSGLHPDHGVYLTWPCRIGGSGISAFNKIETTGPALRDFERLLTARRAGEVGFRW